MRTRRAILGTACATILLAGCADDERDDDENDSGEPEYETRLDELDEYDPVDRTEESTAEIRVAPDGDDRFEPEAVMVDPTTTVEWNWPEPGYEIYPIEMPEPCNWPGDDEGTSHEFRFPFVGKYEIGCTTPDGTEFSGVLFVVDD